MAWDKCGEVECCTRIFRWENGSHFYYYLRKENDIFVDNYRFLHINYDEFVAPECIGKVYKNVLDCKIDK